MSDGSRAGRSAASRGRRSDDQQASEGVDGGGEPDGLDNDGLAGRLWAAELTHPYYEFSRVRYDVTVASPEGGKVELDALSDPRDASKWSADDLISMGFLNTPELSKLLEDTPSSPTRPRRA